MIVLKSEVLQRRNRPKGAPEAFSRYGDLLLEPGDFLKYKDTGRLSKVKESFEVKGYRACTMDGTPRSKWLIYHNNQSCIYMKKPGFKWGPK